MDVGRKATSNSKKSLFNRSSRSIQRRGKRHQITAERLTYELPGDVRAHDIGARA
jgi:hypothetical protein